MSVVWTGDEMRHEQARRLSSKARILAALQSAGPAGRSNADLNAISYRYGARILELRREGHVIESIHEADGSWRFVLHASRPLPGQPGYLASLPTVNPDPVVLVTPTDDPAATGRLF